MKSVWEYLAKLPSGDREKVLRASKKLKNRVTKKKSGTKTVQYTETRIEPPVGCSDLVLTTEWDSDE